MMPFYNPDALRAFLKGFEKDIDQSAQERIARAAKDVGAAVRELITDTEEGLEIALKRALAAPTSLVINYNGYQIIIANPVNATIGKVGGGGVIVTDGKNSVAFDTASGQSKIAGEVHKRGGIYWDLGERDGWDEVFIIPMKE